MNNIIQTIRHAARAAAVLLLALLAAQTAGAEEAVTYIDMDGKTKTVTEYTEVTSNMTGDLPGGTYVVNNDVTINSEITCDSEMNLILCDGATLTVNSSTTFNCNKLNIYSQSTGANMGKLNANGVTQCIGLNIAGGKVTLNGGNNSYSLRVESGDDSGLTVNGGDITIYNNSSRLGTIYIIDNSNITMNGGKLSVTNKIANGCAIYEPDSDNATITFNGGMAEINGEINNLQNVNLNSGNVTINGRIYSRSGYTVNYDFTNPTDSYYIKSFYSNNYTVKVADGKTFTDGTKVFSGTLDADEISVISGKILKPVDFKDVRYALLDGIYHFYRYSGSPISLDYSLSYVGGTVLTKGIDYTETLSATTIKDKGYYTLTITGIGDYSGEIIYDILVGDYNTVTSTMEGGIYAVVGDVTIDEPINVKGDATIFIVNGTTLTANAGITIDDDFTLTLEGTGTLNTIGTNGENGSMGSLGIKGGKGSDGNPGISGKVIVKGVTLNATGGNGGNGGQGGRSASGSTSYGGDGGDGGNGGAAISGTLTVNGGTVNAYGGIGGNGGAVGPRISGGHPGRNKGANGSDAPGIDGTVSYTDIAGAFAEDSNNKTEWSNLTTNSTDKQYVKAYVPTYTVTFNSNGGSPVLDYAVAKGTTIAEPAIIPTRSGVEFFGWMNGNEAYDFNTSVTSDITLTAAWGITLATRQAPDGNYWTTYYNSALGFTIDEDENACAYTATYGDGKLTLHKLGEEIPAGTAVIIVAENNVVSMTTTDLDDFTGDNDLHGVDDDTDVDDITSALGDGTFYVLGMTTVNGEQHFGFHRYTGSEMAAHKAFVHVASSPEAPARSLTMVFDDATGVEEVIEVKEVKEVKDNSWYTINGVKLNGKPSKSGLYIYKGRKVVIK